MEPIVKRLQAGTFNNILFREFAKYTLVGGVAFLLDISTLYILTEFFDIHYLISAAAGFILGLTTNYVLSITWVFKVRRLDSRQKELLIFALIGILGLTLNEFFIWLFTDVMHLHYMVSKGASTTLVYLWNFIARKFVLFK